MMALLTSDAFNDVLGWVAAGLLLGGYVLVSLKKIPPDGLAYQGASFGGSLLLFLNTWHYHALPSATVEAVFMAASLFFIWRAGRGQNN